MEVVLPLRARQCVRDKKVKRQVFASLASRRFIYSMGQALKKGLQVFEFVSYLELIVLWFSCPCKVEDPFDPDNLTFFTQHHLRFVRTRTSLRTLMKHQDLFPGQVIGHCHKTDIDNPSVVTNIIFQC